MWSAQERVPYSKFKWFGNEHKLARRQSTHGNFDDDGVHPVPHVQVSCNVPCTLVTGSTEIS